MCSLLLKDLSFFCCFFFISDRAVLFNPVNSISDSVMVRASASGAGGRGFHPGPGQTKDYKNGTSGYLAWRSAL